LRQTIASQQKDMTHQFSNSDHRLAGMSIPGNRGVELLRV